MCKVVELLCQAIPTKSDFEAHLINKALIVRLLCYMVEAQSSILSLRSDYLILYWNICLSELLQHLLLPLIIEHHLKFDLFMYLLNRSKTGVVSGFFIRK